MKKAVHPVIKFSHRYYKIPKHVENTELIQVFITDKKELSKEFIDYDTGYELPNGDYAQYRLPSGKLLMLVLDSIHNGKSNIWTTLRPAWPTRKVEYYKSLVGKEVNIVINSDLKEE